MKKSLARFTAPALAIGLALSASGGVSAAGPDAGAPGHMYSGHHEGKEVTKFQGRTHRLATIENRIVDVNSDLADLAAVLESEESITFEEYFFYQNRLDVLVHRLNVSSSQLAAVTEKFGEGSAEAAETELAVGFEAGMDAQELLDSTDVVPDFLDVEGPARESAAP